MSCPFANTTACPFINTLLNEKLINEKNVTSKQLMDVLRKLGLFDSIGYHFLEHGVIKSFTNSDNVIENIRDINNHELAEHDVSMTRLDLFQGDNISFNEKLFKKLKRKSADKLYLTHGNFVDFFKDRILDCRRKNPLIKFGTKELYVACGECAMIQLLFADETGNVRIDWLEYFFVREKFPFELQFKMKRISFVELNLVTNKMALQLIQY